MLLQDLNPAILEWYRQRDLNYLFRAARVLHTGQTTTEMVRNQKEDVLKKGIM